MSIYFMPQIQRLTIKEPFFWPIIAQSDRSIFQPALNQFSNVLTCHFAFDEAKK